MLDTNIVVSGLLWRGVPGEILDLARAGNILLLTSPALLAELQDVLHRPKFQSRYEKIGASAEEFAEEFAALALPTRTAGIATAVVRDPDDTAIIACAVSAEADYIVTGDDDLLVLGSYSGIRIVTASTFLAEHVNLPR